MTPTFFAKQISQTAKQGLIHGKTINKKDYGQRRTTNPARTTFSRARLYSTFGIDGISCFEASLVVTESSVLWINICTKKPAHRKSAER